MSFLDILGAVEGAKAPTTIPGRSRDNQAAARKTHPLKQETLLARDTVTNAAATKPPPPTTMNGTTQLKRKAEGDLGPPQPKAQRTNTTDNDGVQPTNAKPNAIAAQPYRGTAGLDRPKAVPRPSQPASRPANAPSSTAQAQAKPAPPKSVPPAVAQASAQGKPAPKKGSYAEILARAAATQTTYTGIKHKTTEEIKKAKPVPPKEKGKVDPRVKPGVRRPGSVEVQSGSEKDRAGPDKSRKPVKPGYQGTARAVPAAAPARPAYQGTIGKRPPGLNGKRPGLAGRNITNPRGLGAASKRYDYYNSDEEEEEEDYASDGSSDMEANLFDVDREEEEALRAAKREDAEEAARLADLEREKKRRKQLALAQSIKEKKERRRFM